MVATDVAELDQTPLAVALVRVVVAPEQTEDAPEMALTAGEVATVTMRVAMQPPDVI